MNGKNNIYTLKKFLARWLYCSLSAKDAHQPWNMYHCGRK